MPTVLVLDTCVLPQNGSIHSNPVLSALLRIAAICQHRVCITDVSLAESLNKRRVRAEQSVDQLEAAIREVSVVFGGHGIDYYVPSPNDAVEYWRSELTTTFEILETDGRDALEALHREASRMPPARATSDGSATGGRDSAIWLTVKRIHKNNTEQTTLFISSNTKDFAASRAGDTVREELGQELNDTVERFLFASSLERAVAMLASASDAEELGLEQLQGLISDTELEQQLLELAQRAVDDRDLPQPVSLSVTAVRERRAYTIESVRLSQIEISFSCLSGSWSEEIPAPDSPLPGRATAWLYQGADEPSFELVNLTFAEASARAAR